MPSTLRPDAARDLVLERVVDVPRELVWRAWTVPEHVKRWFTPLPWTTVECEIDLRPGGIFRTVMRSPEGQDFPNLGCYLEIVKKNGWSGRPRSRPAIGPPSLWPASDPCGVGFLTAVITLESAGKGTKYTALAMHGDEEGRKNHERLGFHDGWGTALDQLVAHARAM